MSITKQKKMLQFLRTSNIYATKEIAIKSLESLTQSSFDSLVDGTPVLARYYDVDGEIKTLLGIIYSNGDDFSITIYDDGSDDFKELSERISEMTEAAGVEFVDGKIVYIADETDPYLSDATSLKDADKILSETLEELSGLVLDNEVELQEVDPSNENVQKSYALFDANGTQLGVTIDIEKDKFLKSAKLVLPSEDPTLTDPVLRLIFVTADGSDSVVDLPVKDLIDFTDVASDKELTSFEELVGLSEEEILSGCLLTAFENAEYVSGAATVVDAINTLDEQLSRVDNKTITGIHVISALTEGENTDIKLNYVHIEDDNIDKAGLTHVSEEGVDKLDVAFDFGTFEYIVTYAYTAEDIENVENPKDANVIIKSSDALTAVNNKTFKDITVSTEIASSVALNAVETVTVSNTEIEGGKDSGNGKVNYNAPELVVSNVKIGGTMYNAFEGNQNNITLDRLEASHVTVEEPTLTHNVFNVYQPSNDAVISVKNSDFNLDVKSTNVLRLANYKNSTGVTVVFENVNWTYENMPTTNADDLMWAGLVLFQPAKTDAALNGDTSYLNTWNFVFKNCKYNGEVVTANNFGTIKQVIYAYNISNDGLIIDPTKEIFNVSFE